MFFGYCRVSTDDQKNGTSPEEQRRVIQGVAMIRGLSGFDVQIFEDIGISGAMPLRMRPAGCDLWDAAQKGDVVCASKFDRMFRDVLDAHRTFREFQERGVDLILYDMGNDPVTRDGGMSKVFFGLLSVFAEFERDRIRERVVRGKAIKLEQGGHVGGLAPVGFKIVGSGRSARLEKDEREQELLRAVSDYRGQPLTWVARKLTERGFLARSGKPYDATRVRRMLQRLEEPV